MLERRMLEGLFVRKKTTPDVRKCRPDSRMLENVEPIPNVRKFWYRMLEGPFVRKRKRPRMLECPFVRKNRSRTLECPFVRKKLSRFLLHGHHILNKWAQKGYNFFIALCHIKYFCFKEVIIEKKLFLGSNLMKILIFESLQLSHFFYSIWFKFAWQLVWCAVAFLFLEIFRKK